MLTKFQKRALEAIRAGGNVVYAQGDDTGKGEKWTNGDGYRVIVLNPDNRTFGRLGRPTITALMDNSYLERDAEKAGRYQLTGKEV